MCAYYEPPTQNLAIFDPDVFTQNDEPLTITTGSKYFLRFPNAQGEENLQAVNVNGVLTANSTTNLNSAVSIPNNDMFVRNIRIGFGGGNLDRNTIVGINSGSSNTTGNDNVLIGANAGTANTTGGSNVFVGSFAGRFNTTGTNNTLVGRDAGNSNISGARNTFIGREAGYRCIGNDNVCIGNESDCSGNLINSMAIGSGVKATTSNTIFLGLSTQTTQIAGPVVLNANNNLTMNAGTGRISQPSVVGDVSTKNQFKYSEFIFNSNNTAGTNNAFEFYDGVNGRGLFLLPNVSTGSLSDTNISNDCVLSSRAIQNTNAITISNWNSNMRNGLRVFTTDISNCGLTLQCGQNTGAAYTELAMNYNRISNNTTTTFNNAINFNPTLPIATNSSRRLLSGLGTLSFTDISGNNTTTGSVVSRIWTDSSLVSGLNGMYYDCGINGGFHQFLARDGGGNVSTPVYFGASLTSVSNTFVVRNATTTTDRFDVVMGTSATTNIRCRSSTASTDGTININCDTVNAGGISTSNAVLVIRPTNVLYRRPIEFNYATMPNATNQLGFMTSVALTDNTFSSQASASYVGSSLSFGVGTWHIVAIYEILGSGSHNLTTFELGIGTSNSSMTSTMPYLTSYIREQGVNISTTKISRQVSLVLQFTSPAGNVVYFNEYLSWSGGGTATVGVAYTYTRIG